MRVVDLDLKGSYAVSVAALGNATLVFNLPAELKIHAIDVVLVFDSGDTWSKDITFRLEELGGQREDYAFWDDSNLTIFSDFMKLLNRAYDELNIYILNNDAANAIVVETLYVRVYYYD